MKLLRVIIYWRALPQYGFVELYIFLFKVVLGNFTDSISKILSATTEQKARTLLLQKSTIHFTFYHFILFATQ